MIVLHVDHLSKTFYDFWRRPMTTAVKDVSFDVKEGEVFGLLGPNGSGKSTTIKMILGLLKPESGDLKVFGLSSGDLDVRRKIGYLPEISYLHPFLTPYETLSYYADLFSLPHSIKQERIVALLKMVKLEEVSSRRVATFSKGMVRRLGLAQALINAPRLLILDEPTSGLDPIGTREVKDLIISLKAAGVSILMSSHLLADVADCCDRIAIFDKGLVCGAGRVAELLINDAGERITLEEYFLAHVTHGNSTFMPAPFLVEERA